MKIKNLIVFVFGLLLSTTIWAQQKTITGSVSDKDGGLPGVNVIVKGTTIGTITRPDGTFSLEVPENTTTLVFSFIGFVTQDIDITDKSIVAVIMKTDAIGLDEVVVVGYGTLGKKDITGSITVVSAEEIVERSATNISNAMQGAVAGVEITRTSSQPGEGNTIRVRGNTTLQGSNSPLVLIDDIPGSMNSVNPEQVESITVLKDAAAAAIYGSRAAAGVIIITTKRAKDGVFRASYSGEYFITTPADERQLADDPVDYMQGINERLWNDNGNGDDQFLLYSEQLINAYKNGEHLLDRDTYPYTDWRAVLLKKTATGHRHNVNISAGTEKVKTNLLVGYETQDAFYENRDWERMTLRLNNDFEISKKLSAKADVSFRYIDDNRPITNPMVAVSHAPVFNSHHQDGRLAGGRNGGSVYAKLHSGSFSDTDTYNIQGKFALIYEPIDDLKVTLNVAPSVSFSEYSRFQKPVPFWGADDPNQENSPTWIDDVFQANLEEKRTRKNSLTKQALVTYVKSFNKHSVNLLAGYEDLATRYESVGARGIEFISPDFPFLHQAPTDKVFEKGTEIWELASASVFGRVNYNYDSKYYLAATVRQDGSSRFASDYRWGTFPSVSAAWTLSNEEFMNSVEFVDFLKLKASYGQMGNDRLGNYLYLSTLSVSDVLIDQGGTAEGVRGLYQSRLTTPDIKWETTATTNLGLEIGLFDNRLSAEAEYFQKETTDMLLSLSVPDLVGFGDPIVNVGSMSTTGWSLTASWNDSFGDDFNYSVSFNISDSKSIIGDINGKRLFDGNTLSAEGSEFKELFGYRSTGLYQTQEEVDNAVTTNNRVLPGDVGYMDLAGPPDENGDLTEPDGVINGHDKVFLGSSLNHYIFGGRINADYKGFDFALTFQGVGKNNYHLNQSFIHTNPEVQKLSKAYFDDKWSHYNTPEENKNALYPRYTMTGRSNNFQFSDFWLLNGAYLRIKNLSLGYTIPTQALSEVGVSKLRLYVKGTDLFTLKSLPQGIDPEQTNAGSYYITKSIIFGVQINF